MNYKNLIWPAVAMLAGIAVFKSPDFLAVIFRWVENGNSNFIVYLSLVAWPFGGTLFIYGLVKLIQATRN